MLNTNRDTERLALAKRLKEVINNSGFTKAEIARACDVSPQALTGWLKTGRVGKDSLVLIANKMDIDLGWLVSGFARASDKLHEPSNVTYGPDLQGAFPVISWVQAGSWAEVVDHTDITDEWIPCPGKCGKYSYVLRVSGESMFDPAGRKSFKDGDLIFVDPEKQAENGSLVVVKMTDDETATFKQLMIEENGTRYLKALNPSWPNRIMQINGSATICGVVTYKVEPM